MVSARRTSIAVRYLDRRQTSWALQANEGNFARLPGEPVGVVAQPCLGIFREEHGLAQPYPEPSHLPVHLDRRGSLGLVAGDQHFLQAPGMDEHIGDYRPYVAREPFQMVGERKTDGLARLGHDVRRVNNRPGEARELHRALTPAPSKAGMVLVKRLPGLRMTTSDFSMAAITPGGAAAPAGSTSTLATALPTSRTTDSPRVTVPSAYVTMRVRLLVAAG